MDYPPRAEKVKNWTLIEPCAGTAAIAMHLLGARAPLVPYQGNKWRYRKQIAALFEEMGYRGAPSRVELNDPGPFGVTLGEIFDPERVWYVVGSLGQLLRYDPRSVYDSLHKAPAAAHPSEFAAEHLFLQRIAFSGKAVTLRGGEWRSPGFMPVWAYGAPARDNFGAVHPALPRMVQKLAEFAITMPRNVRVNVTQTRARPQFCEAPALVYIDPPYGKSTGYTDVMLRSQVIDLARVYQSIGAAVVISEASPLDIPGFRHLEITPNKTGGASLANKAGTEYLTYWAPEGAT
jgi:hypothetical protein